MNVLIDKRYEISYFDFESILRHLDQYEKLISAKIIIIKPNFAAGSYIAADSHVVTDIRFLRKIIEHIRCLNSVAKIFIAESDSTGYGYAFLKFLNLGVDKWNMPGLFPLDLSRDVLGRVENSNARYFNNIDRQLWLSKTLLNADYVILTANLKSHSVTNFTGACKNMFGFLPAMNKEQYHTEIHDVIHDLTLAVKTDLSIVDGFYGMGRNGPVQGDAVNLGYRVFSSSPVVADITCCKAVGLDYRKVKYLKMLNSYESSQSSCVEQDISSIRKKIDPPTFWIRFFCSIGLALQGIGRDIYELGHRIHCADSPSNAVIILLRPFLLKRFGMETLKRWREALHKRNA